jgi:hypothetical protein
MSFAAITHCVASQRVFVVVSLLTQSGNFWIHPRMRVRFSFRVTPPLTLCELGLSHHRMNTDDVWEQGAEGVLGPMREKVTRR